MARCLIPRRLELQAQNLFCGLLTPQAVIRLNHNYNVGGEVLNRYETLYFQPRGEVLNRYETLYFQPRGLEHLCTRLF